MAYDRRSISLTTLSENQPLINPILSTKTMGIFESKGILLFNVHKPQYDSFKIV